MNTYEGLFIFGEAVQEERLKDASAYVTGEIEKAGGTVLNTRDLGRRNFTRPLAKKASGWYLSVTFKLAPEKVAGLSARYKLSDDVFRCQIVKLDDQFAKNPPVLTPPAPPAEWRSQERR